MDTHPVFNSMEQTVITRLESLPTSETLIPLSHSIKTGKNRHNNQYDKYETNSNFQCPNANHSTESNQFCTENTIRDTNDKPLNSHYKCVSGNIISHGQKQNNTANHNSEKTFTDRPHQSISALSVSNPYNHFIGSSYSKMAYLRSSSNQILNCRTIDDGYLQGLYQPLTRCNQKSEDCESPANSSKERPLETIKKRAKNTGIFGYEGTHSLVKGFDTLDTFNTHLNPSQSRPKSLRGRNFYKCEISPKVNLQVNFQL